MPPIHVLDLPSRLARQLLIHINYPSRLVTPLHPNYQQHTRNQDGAARSQIESITNLVVRRIKRQEAPSRNKSTNVTKHDHDADCRRACGVRDDVRRNIRSAESTEGESPGRYEERGSVANLRIVAGEEHDIANDDERRARDEEEHAFVKAPADIWQEDCEERADDVWRYRVQLLGDDATVWVDRANDRRCEY